MDLSVFYEIQTSDVSPAAVRRAYDQTIEQVILADKLGYRTAWFVEHHFLPGYCFCPAPELILTYLASKTERIRLGHGIVQLPFRINHPLRVAERIAVLDILSKGRVEFGGGRVTIGSELEAFGVDPADTRRQWEEALHMLPKMWMEDNFQWEGDLISVPPRSVVPKPVQQPHPPMWVACSQPATIEFAGRNGLGVLGLGIDLNNAAEFVRIYREAARDVKPIGAFANNRFAILVTALCCHTDEEALELQGPSVKLLAEQTAAFQKPWIEGSAPPTYEYFTNWVAQGALKLKNASVQDLVRSSCVGSPETCLKMLQRLEDAGVDETMLFMQLYQTPHDAIMRSLRLIAEEVGTRLESSENTQAGEKERSNGKAEF
jgi:alkanesulfonate monooxygenase SsuD/methylene tetrahydromethanopterin reductase-like flavin-dependent oxidoreductase (luciferase family)